MKPYLALAGVILLGWLVYLSVVVFGIRSDLADYADNKGEVSKVAETFSGPLERIENDVETQIKVRERFEEQLGNISTSVASATASLGVTGNVGADIEEIIERLAEISDTLDKMQGTDEGEGPGSRN